MCINSIYNGKNNILIKYTPGYLLLLLLAFQADNLLARQNDSITATTISYVNADIELTASCFLTGSDSLIIFLPSVYAPFEEQESLTREIADKGLSACFSHVFNDLFLPMEGKYYKDIPLDHLLALLRKVRDNSHKSVYFAAHGKGNRIAYRLAYLAGQAKKAPAISGLILLSPNLLNDTPAPGTDQQYMPLLDKKTLPVFIFQPTYSPHHWHLDTLIDKITRSGTYVRYQRLDDVRDGYALREDRSKKEQMLREQAALLFENAIKQLTNGE